jgi:cell division protein FtsW
MPPGSPNARSARRLAPPLEHRILMTATMCLIAFGAVMVYSASAPLTALAGGYGTGEFVVYLIAMAIGLGAMWVCERYGLRLITPALTRWMLLGSCGLLLVVLVPGLGRDVSGARRWFAVGPLEFQPSELAKLALVLYAARYLADNPRRLRRDFRQAMAPIAVALGPACLLIAVEPDLGTAFVCFATIMLMLAVAGAPSGHLVRILLLAAAGVALMVLVHPYELARLTSFLHPLSERTSAGFQAEQAQMAVGSGGLWGVGLAQSVGKMWLPEAQSDFILAVVGQELGTVGITVVVGLYALIAYAGLRTARRAASGYLKLLAFGLTSLILCQGILNIFVVLGIAPLTGVPLPFISYAPTNLIVMLASVGLLLGIARPAARELRLVDGERARTTWGVSGEEADDRGGYRRDRGSRGARVGGSQAARG